MQKAFTLAETLITLSIIGIIAVMGIASLMKAKPDQNALAYKKTFYAIQDAIRYLANDTNRFPSSEQVFKLDTVNPDPDFSRVLNGKAYQVYLCEQVAAALNTTGAIHCGNSAGGATDGTISGAGDVEFQLQSGAVLNGFNQTFADEDSTIASANERMPQDSITICVDVNGLNKGPNKGCEYKDRDVKNRDQFKFRVHEDGKVSTGSEEESGIDWAVENAILEETGINK